MVGVHYQESLMVTLLTPSQLGGVYRESVPDWLLGICYFVTVLCDLNIQISKRMVFEYCSGKISYSVMTLFIYLFLKKTYIYLSHGIVTVSD